MRPIDYTKTSRYGKTMAAERAATASGMSPLKNRGPVEAEAAFYAQGIEHSLRLGELGLQKEMFDKGLAENKRQFDVGITEGKRQFDMNMDMSRDRFKHIRRQNNRAELLGMANIGISLGLGYLQYKQNRRAIDMNKILHGYLEAAKAKMQGAKKQ